MEKIRGNQNAEHAKVAISTDDRAGMKARHRLELFAGSALYGLLVAFAGVVSGLVAALRPDQVKASWPPTLSGTPNAATVFWIGIAAWVPMYFFREYVKGKEVERLARSSSDIKEAVQTLPPIDFVNDYSEMTSRSHRTLWELLPRQPSAALSKPTLQDELAKAIRALLVNLATLARSYDQRKVLYGVNVMVFVPRGAAEPFFSGIDENRVQRYLPPGFNLQNLEGVLHLKRSLSVQASFDPRAGIVVTGAQDAMKSVPPQTENAKVVAGAPADIVFGIPEKAFLHDERGRWRVLPGSPMTFIRWNQSEPKDVSKGVHYMHDFHRLEQEMKDGQGEELYLDDDVLRHLSQDYSDGGPESQVRSFLSFPLVGGDNKAFGTLNIHCSEPGILGNTNEGRIVNFVGVVAPMVNDVASLVKAWRDA